MARERDRRRSSCSSFAVHLVSPRFHCRADENNGGLSRVPWNVPEARTRHSPSQTLSHIWVVLRNTRQRHSSWQAFRNPMAPPGRWPFPSRAHTPTHKSPSCILPGREFLKRLLSVRIVALPGDRLRESSALDGPRNGGGSVGRGSHAHAADNRGSAHKGHGVGRQLAGGKLRRWWEGLLGVRSRLCRRAAVGNGVTFG